MKYLILLIVVFSNLANSNGLDDKLNIIKKLYELTPKQCNDIRSPNATANEIQLGELFFTSKLLSGNKNIACIDCHLEKFHSTDGLPLAVGVGGKGEGKERLYDGVGTIVPRNAISLTGIGNKKFTQFFWDGKVGEDKDKNIYSQLGMKLSHKFDNTLAVASVMPILERDELIGSSSMLNTNEIRRAVGGKLYQKRFDAVSTIINKRFLNLDKENSDIKALLDKLGIENVDLITIGNFISKFIANEFKCSTSKFDKYLQGDSNLLSDPEKRGAIIFYGKGRCASCHKGNFYSDNLFHSIGVFKGNLVHTLDIGI